MCGIANGPQGFVRGGGVAKLKGNRNTLSTGSNKNQLLDEKQVHGVRRDAVVTGAVSGLVTYWLSTSCLVVAWIMQLQPGKCQ